MAPGTVTGSQPSAGTLAAPPKESMVCERGARPLAFRPWMAPPSQTIAKASLPRPFEVGSVTVSTAAAAMAASTAVPPCVSMESPACEASG